MRRWGCSVASLLFACGVFIYATYVNSEANWEPVHLPLPAKGIQAGSWFRISTSGSFHLRVDTPKTTNDSSSVACNLQVVITDDAERKTVVHLDQLSGTGERQGIQLWESRSFRISRRGDHRVTLVNGGETLFVDRGAMATLERDVHQPTETYLRNSLMRGAGWLALAAGVLTALMAAATMRADAVPRAREDGDQSQ